MKIQAFTMKLKAGKKEEYKKRHDAIWPELIQLLHSNGVSDYSIFFDAETNTLFAVQKQDGINSSQDLGDSRVVRNWWSYMKDIMETNPDDSPVSKNLEQVFYMK